MHQYEIDAAINNAVNEFVVRLGWIHEPWHVNRILPSGEDSLLGGETVVKIVNVSINQWSFDFLAIIRDWQSCALYMDAKTSNMVMEFKIRDLERTMLQKFKEHLSAYPHNIGM